MSVQKEWLQVRGLKPMGSLVSIQIYSLTDPNNLCLLRKLTGKLQLKHRRLELHYYRLGDCGTLHN
jgi:hypothetical protein